MVIEAEDPIKPIHISISNTYKVFDNLHMLWMCIWMRPYYILVAPEDQAFGSELEFRATLRQQMTVKCGD